MKKLVFAIVAAFSLAFLAVGVTSGASIAQSEDSKVLEACGKGKEKISAQKLPSALELKKCPVEDRPIVDNGVGVSLPEPGSGVHVEALSPDGVQELVVVRKDDGEVELAEVGDDTKEDEAASQDADSAFAAAASGPNQCRDRAYNLTRWKVYRAITYRYNYRTTPPYLNRRATARQIQRGGANIVGTRNTCGVGDLVESGIGFRGDTRRQAQVSADGQCTGNDGVNVTSFGRLGGRTLGVTCTYFQTRQGFDRVVASDLKLDRSGTRWTTRPGARSCSDRYDIQGVVTHERGHTFGMAHVSERYHGKMTMSTIINGPCQASERTLGRGDFIGLGRKYR